MQRNEVGFSILLPETKKSIYSFFKSKDLLAISLIDKESKLICDQIFEEKLKFKFNINLSENDNAKLAYKNIRNKIKKELELFLFYSQHSGIDAYNCDYHLHRIWLNCVTYDNSFEQFITAVKLAKEKLVRDFSGNLENLKKDEDKYANQFYCLLNSPFELTHNDLLESLSILCRMNAFYTIQIFFKKHQAILNTQPEFSKSLPIFLMREAISCLQPESVESLLMTNDFKEKYLLQYQDSDNSHSLFSSPLYFALSLPTVVQCLTNRFGQQIKYDNSALIKIIKILLSYGIKAEQNCIFSPLFLSIPETNRKSIDMDKANLKIMSKDDLEKFKQQAGPEEVEFINSLINISTSISQPKQINMEISKNCIHLAKDFLSLSEAKYFRQDYLDLLTDLSQGKILIPNQKNNENSIRLDDTVKSRRL
jgi:hypothetical protein